MLPQVARPPRPFSEQFGNSGFGTPPFETFSNLRQPDRFAHLPFRSARSYTSTTESHGSACRAVPVETRGDRRPTIGGLSTRGHYHDSSEHMLRRKTPNGTLAAGYDGTPVSWSTKAPALKHVVLPLSGGSSTNLQALPSFDDHRNRQVNRGRDWNHQHDRILEAVDGGDMHISGSGSWVQLPSISDSPPILWNQIRTYGASSSYPNNAFQVPTVIQPPYQPSPGPTVSNDAGLYGPYWPDGRFVPYRPAAVGHHAYQHCLERYPMPSPDYNSSSTTGDINSIHQGRIFQHQSIGEYRHSILHDRYSGPQQPYDVMPELYAALAEGSRTPTTQSVQRTSNPHFREKALSWAHSIYVDLLAFLRQMDKENSNMRNSHTARIYPKNNIYPKPPRHTSTYIGSSGWVDTNNDEQHVLNPQKKVTVSLSTPILPRSSERPITWQNLPKETETRYGRAPSSEVPHYLSPFDPPLAPNTSPRERAKQALDMLTTLCDQSNWSWIDAMLLGGCLAYGLENYQGAIEWYSKILLVDPRHVEAMANSAAAFKSLNRLQEAETHWLEAIKLRPTYFEAVEHLVGLLCETHRGKEAIKIIEFVENKLRIERPDNNGKPTNDSLSNSNRSSGVSIGALSDAIILDYDIADGEPRRFSRPAVESEELSMPGFGSSGFLVAGSQNGRVLALIHAKGNMLYSLGDVDGASKAFEDAILVSTGKEYHGVEDLIARIVEVLSLDRMGTMLPDVASPWYAANKAPLLLPPDKALQTARLLFYQNGDLPGLRHVPEGIAKRSAVSTTSNCLLSLAKIFQDAMSTSSSKQRMSRAATGVGDILVLYYLSLSLQPSPSTANNVGILLASVQQSPGPKSFVPRDNTSNPIIPGVVPGSGVALALAYYHYGLSLDSEHAHIYTNLGSLLKDIGQLSAAVSMYEKAVKCDGSFDIALANLANAVKDQGRTSDAIAYYKRAVASSPEFAEAVCGLANALNSVCDWAGRGGVILDGGRQDRWHVDEKGMIVEAEGNGGGWMKRVVDIVSKQLDEGSGWGRGILSGGAYIQILNQLEAAESGSRWSSDKRSKMRVALADWVGQKWEGARLVRLIERATKRAMHRWYIDRYIMNRQLAPANYPRPQLPSSLTIPSAPTVLPFHTFTCPLSAKDIRMISERNGLRISSSTLRAPWLPGSVFPPPCPPSPHLNIGYVSSDFNNHPLAHLMQSVFGMHDPSRAKAFCYATTASDNSVHRHQIEREAPVFRDVNGWSVDRLVQQIVRDGIHILVNLNGYTRGARNEVFAARPAPIQMSFMGFAGTLGAEWCDYILADETAIPRDTLRPWRSNLGLEDLLGNRQAQDEEGWVYSENIIFCRETFFCCDHAQSESRDNHLSWEEEQRRRWAMRKELFPSLSDDAVILGNFNQLYKIEPTTFRTWLRILERVPNAILWLLRFPELGEGNLKRTARDWAGDSVASRIWFTDVAPKHQHISRARVCDLFLDTPECNAHTTAADVLWSSTPLLTLPRYKYKMCSRMAASILKGALPNTNEGRMAATELIASDDDEYERFAIRLAKSISYNVGCGSFGNGAGRLHDLRKLLYDSRWTCALFDTRRWVADLEEAYDEAWRRWVAGESGDIYL